MLTVDEMLDVLLMERAIGGPMRDGCPGETVMPTLSSQLEEAVADGAVPWGLHEAYGVKSGDEMYLPPRRREPKYTGLIGQRYEAAIKKGYLDLGLIDPSVAKERLEGARFADNVAAKVGSILMQKDVAFIRDPEGILAIKEIDPQRLPPLIRTQIAAHFAEERDYAVEADDMDGADRLSRAEQEASKATVAIQKVAGQTGAGYKITMKPTFSEISDRARGRR